jgi:mannose/fructose/sorbose-specific phosphotransferase system IIA component
MVSIIVVSHGHLASALIGAVEMIAGPQEGLYAVEIGPGESPDTFTARLNRVLRAVEPSPALILVDLLGGTPYNVAARQSVVDRNACVSGANLPMLLELVVARDGMSAQELAEAAERVGRDAIRNMGPLLNRARTFAAK